MRFDARSLIVALVTVICFSSCSGSTNSGSKNASPDVKTKQRQAGASVPGSQKSTTTAEAGASNAIREAEAHFERGSNFLNKWDGDTLDQDLRAAIVEFTECVRLDPAASQAFYRRAIAWVRLRQHDKAIADFSETIRLKPKQADAFSMRGKSYLCLQKHDDAIADFTKAIDLNPNDASLLGERASVWTKVDDFSKALEFYNRAIRLANKDTALLHGRGWIHETTKNYEKALADYNRATALNPNRLASLNSKAWILATCPDDRIRNQTEAVAQAKKACELSECKIYFFIDTLSAALAEAGDFESAAKYQQQAIELNRDDTAFVKDAEERLTLFAGKKPYRTQTSDTPLMEAVAAAPPPKNPVKTTPQPQPVPENESVEKDRKTDDRLPTPSADEAEKSKMLITDLFKDKYAKSKSKPSDRAAFAAELLKQAAGTKDDPTARYVLLMEARDIGASAGDAVTAMQAADELVADYQVPPGSLRLDVAAILLKSKLTQTSGRIAAETLMASAEEVLTLADDEWKTALELFMAAEVAAQKSKIPTLLGAAKNRVKQVEALMAEAKKVEADEMKLKSLPDDQAANLAVGRFMCFYKQDWETGLVMLAKGSDEALNEASARDRAGNGGDVNQQLAAADAWYDLSEKVEAEAKPALKIRAYFWYAKSAGGLSGLNKAKAEKRLAELQTLVESRSNKAKLWAGIRKAVAEGKVQKWGTIGGVFANKNFEELPPEGAVLIGLRYTIQDNNAPGSMQPIYLTARGEVAGKVYATNSKQSAPLTMKAKPGYAVGAMYMRGGGSWDAFQLYFMRMTDKGLDVRDRYASAYIGGDGGGEGMLGGDGNFIVGILGRMTDDTKPYAMSPISLTIQPPVPESERPKGRVK